MSGQEQSSELLSRLKVALEQSGATPGMVRYFTDPKNVAKLSASEIEAFIKKLEGFKGDIEGVERLYESRNTAVNEFVFNTEKGVNDVLADFEKKQKEGGEKPASPKSKRWTKEELEKLADEVWEEGK